MVWGAIIGAAASLAGSMMSSKASKSSAKAAAKGAQFRPGNVMGPAGNATFNRDYRSGQWNLALSPNAPESALRTAMQDRALEGVSGGEFGHLSSFLRQQTAPSIFDFYQGVQDEETLLGDAALGAADEFTGIADATTGAGLGSIFAGLSGPSGLSASRDVMGFGRSLLSGAGSASFNELAAQRLSALRGIARPAEERLVNSRINNLFSRGRLGTTGGSQLMGELSDSLSREDMARVVASQDFAQGQLNTERQFMQGQQNLGANLFEMGLRGINAEQAHAMNVGNFGQQLLQLGNQSRAGSLSAVEASDNAFLSRGNSRLLAAQNMFNFGDALDASSIDRGLQLLGGAQTIDQTLLDQARIGASVGSSQAAAGANAGQFRMAGSGSILGGALQGIGAGIMNSQGNNTQSLAGLFSGMFGRGNTQTTPTPLLSREVPRYDYVTRRP